MFGTCLPPLARMQLCGLTASIKNRPFREHARRRRFSYRYSLYHHLNILSAAYRASASLLGQVFESLAEHGSNMSVGERVEYRLSLASAAYQLISAQYSQLMRHGGRGHFEHCGDLSDTQLPAYQRTEYAYTRRIAENLKQIGKVAQLLRARRGHIRFVFTHGVPQFLCRERQYRTPLQHDFPHASHHAGPVSH